MSEEKDIRPVPGLQGRAADKTPPAAPIENPRGKLPGMRPLFRFNTLDVNGRPQAAVRAARNQAIRRRNPS